MIKIKKINDLLFEVFDNKRFIKIDYLKWLYRSSPEGKEISSEHIEKGKFRGHFCTLPQNFNNDKNKKYLLFGHILNIAVADDMRGKGIFIALARKCVKENIRKGTDALWGVANANTTHGYVAYLKFKLICGLPVKDVKCNTRWEMKNIIGLVYFLLYESDIKMKSYQMKFCYGIFLVIHFLVLMLQLLQTSETSINISSMFSMISNS